MHERTHRGDPHRDARHRFVCLEFTAVNSTTVASLPTLVLEVYRGKLNNAQICVLKNPKVKPLRHRGFAFYSRLVARLLRCCLSLKYLSDMWSERCRVCTLYLRSGNAGIQSQCNVPCHDALAHANLLGRAHFRQTSFENMIFRMRANQCIVDLSPSADAQ